MNNVNKRIISCVSKIAGEPIHANTNLKELDLDSLDLVEMVMSLENEFNIAIDDAKAETLMENATNIRDIRKYLKKYHNIPDLIDERKEKLKKINEEVLENTK